MEQLTYEQTEVLRSARPLSRNLGNNLSQLAHVLAGVCLVDSDDEHCPACSLYARVRDAENLLRDIGGDYDAALLRSDPKLKRKAAKS